MYKTIDHSTTCVHRVTDLCLDVYCVVSVYMIYKSDFHKMKPVCNYPNSTTGILDYTTCRLPPVCGAPSWPVASGSSRPHGLEPFEQLVVATTSLPPALICCSVLQPGWLT